MTPGTGVRWWDVECVPAVHRWTGRVVPVLLGVEVVLFVALAGRVPYATVVALVVFAVCVVATVLAWMNHRRHRRRLFPDATRGDRLPPRWGPLNAALWTGRPVPPDDRGDAGRVVWWELSRLTCAMWFTPGLVVLALDGPFDPDSPPHWSVWTGLQLVAAALAITAHVRTRGTHARWQRLARDADRVTPPRSCRADGS